MNRKQRIEGVLTRELRPTELNLRDDSALHVGHAGASPSGETHYSLIIESEMFKNIGRMERHRMIYGLLTAEFTNGLHAISIEAWAPGER